MYAKNSLYRPDHVNCEIYDNIYVESWLMVQVYQRSTLLLREVSIGKQVPATCFSRECYLAVNRFKVFIN